jgi:ABC-type Fe3+-hydroxamate transport system substrate-binding protein
MKITDQMGREIEWDGQVAGRIVSLVPSQTALLHALNLDASVVGITRFCIHPKAWHQRKPRVGGTKTVNLQRVAALKPDLILGNKEENTRAQIEALETSFPVWMSDILSLHGATDMIRQVGRLTGTENTANTLAGDIETAFGQIQFPRRLRAAYLIWNNPIMAAGGETFIHDILEKTGFDNIFALLPRYPEVTVEDIIRGKPDCILLASEPFPFREKHRQAWQLQCPEATVHCVEGEHFSWYGPHLLQTPDYAKSVHNAC